MIDGFIKDDFLISINNYNEWIDIQLFLFKYDIFWCGLIPDKLFDSKDIIFPNFLTINYISDEKKWVIGYLELKNIHDYTYIKPASQFIRLAKLKKINEINLRIQ